MAQISSLQSLLTDHFPHLLLVSKLTTKLPSWDDARHLLDQFKGHALMTVAAKVCLGITLQQLKEKEGYRPGVNTADCGISWPDLVKKELGISDDTARRFILAAAAVKAKIAKIGGSPRLLSLLDQPVQSLSKGDAAALQDAIRTATDGESLTSILQEFKLIKCPPPLPDHSAGGSAPRTQKSEEQLAWDFAGGDVISELNKVRTGSKFHHALHSMPLSKTETVPFGLIDYVTELREAYEAAEKVLTLRMK
jgi:hypothetical protein